MNITHSDQVVIYLVLGWGGALIWIISYVIHYKKKVNVSLAFCVLCFYLWISTLRFELSHWTYYRYNDWWILGKSVTQVEQRYGTVDNGGVYEGIQSRCGYTIYEDTDGMILTFMPDHGTHYYYMYYDESGVIYKVEDAIQPGG